MQCSSGKVRVLDCPYRTFVLMMQLGNLGLRLHFTIAGILHGVEFRGNARSCITGIIRGFSFRGSGPPRKLQPLYFMHVVKMEVFQKETCVRGYHVYESIW